MKKYKFTVTIWEKFIDDVRLFDIDQGFDTFEDALAYANFFALKVPGNPATIWRNGCRVEDVG